MFLSYLIVSEMKLLRKKSKKERQKSKQLPAELGGRNANTCNYSAMKYVGLTQYDYTPMKIVNMTY